MVTVLTKVSMRVCKFSMLGSALRTTATSFENKHRKSSPFPPKIHTVNIYKFHKYRSRNDSMSIFIETTITVARKSRLIS